jgi:hypothetical protein
METHKTSRDLAIPFLLSAALLVGGFVAGVPGVGVTPVLAEAAAAQLREPAAAPERPLPAYKPRKDSVPRARIGGSARGGEPGDPALVALVPDHVGLTLKSDPSLCWFLSQPTTQPLTLTILDSRAIKPILETTLPSPARPGLQCVHLRDHGITLKEREQYRWFVTLVLDPDKPSRDIVSGGMIERIPFSEGCALGLPCSWTCELDAVYQYAENGLWYDAIACLHELIKAAPDDPLLLRVLDHLLKQSDIHLPPVRRAG